MKKLSRLTEDGTADLWCLKMTYDNILMMSRRVEGHLQGHRIVGLMLPGESSYEFPWKEIESPVSWAPFETVYRAGSFLVPFLGTGTDLEHRIDAVRVLRMLRADGLIVAGGCSSLTGKFGAGSYVIINDHVNCTGENPLRGPNDERLGPRYPDMCEPYDAHWSQCLERSAASMGLPLQRAAYGRVDPYGTDDEFAAWAKQGIDLAGEGLVDEVIAAVHCGLPVAAVGFVEKVWPDEGNSLCSSVSAQSAEYGRLTEIINQCLLSCRGGLDDG